MKELLITLDSKGKTPLYEQIYGFIKSEIQKRKILPGEALPSSRSLSRQLMVSRSTVDLAYEQLVSEGYLESVPCKGYFVCDMEELFQLAGLRTNIRQRPEQVKETYPYDFAVNGIDPEGFPQNAWRKISKQILMEDDGSLFQLGDAQGEWELREAIASYLHHARGVEAGPEQIVVGAGNDYLLMLLSVILGTDTRIAMENPTYKSAWNCFESLGHEMAAVSMDDAGMVPDQLEESKADVAYVMPSHQFPMGMVMPMKRRLQLLAWAKASSGRYIIEDDYDSEFRYKGKPIPALQGYDQNDTVIYIGTFSKAIAPAIRISYMVLPQTLLAAYEERGKNFSVTVSRVDQKIIELFLREGYFERHLNRMRALYKGKRDLILKLLKPLRSVCCVSGEHAGVHLLLQLLNGMTEEEAVERTKAVWIKVYPLHQYYVNGERKRETEGILLGYATLEESVIETAMNALNRAWS